MDAYPDDPAEPPRLRLFIVAFLPNGDSYDGEAIDTDGLDTREFTPGLATAKRQRWLASRTVAAQARLLDRIGETVDDG